MRWRVHGGGGSMCKGPVVGDVLKGQKGSMAGALEWKQIDLDSGFCNMCLSMGVLSMSAPLFLHLKNEDNSC